MASLNSIVRFLNKELKVKSVPDDSKNGLQIRCKKEVKRVGFAVDACISTFEKAKKKKVDLLIVHHGLLWDGKSDHPVLKKKRIDFLKKNKISMYGCHLPLDKHEKYGNNIQLAKILGLEKVKKFGVYHGSYIGYQGVFPKNIEIGKITSKLNKELKTRCKVLRNNKNRIKSIGIVSGGGRGAIGEAAKKKLDCFLTGEVPHSAVNDAKDNKLNVILGGHYATETVGVKALMPVLKEKFKIETVFIDNPTGF